MKNLSLLLILFLATVNLNAQDFQGMAVYESKTGVGDQMAKLDGNKEITPEMRTMIEAQMKKMFEKTFVLNFNRTESIYKEEEKLDAPGSNPAFKMMSSMMGGGGVQYKNIKEKVSLQEKDIFGKEFLVTDTLPKIQWKMLNETKKIGEYTCYKATAEVPVDRSNMMNYKPKKGAEEAMKEKSEEELKKTNFMDMVEMPDTKIITAWYAPEIPVSQGPENYWGLPGLILEVSDDKTTILCSKIVLNVKEKAEIKKPTKGEKVSPQEFADLMVKKIQQMQEMYGGGRGGIRIGG
ncbi:GLPGLI family protein [Flavobacterium coralii]|uniref:GLPGLI family protein n=1 Tax=Flavobacterium coralii TaxID=2838017 RepID=UPI000C5020B9|nr:GLPGLI family protein [Flavobacterium sp.]|tara:strand:- start:2399 stop:3277 length:879 start_codon:yes stop_codon:yes gene_type:complete